MINDYGLEERGNRISTYIIASALRTECNHIMAGELKAIYNTKRFHSSKLSVYYLPEQTEMIEEFKVKIEKYDWLEIVENYMLGEIYDAECR